MQTGFEGLSRYDDIERLPFAATLNFASYGAKILHGAAYDPRLLLVISHLVTLDLDIQVCALASPSV